MTHKIKITSANLPPHLYSVTITRSKTTLHLISVLQQLHFRMCNI